MNDLDWKITENWRKKARGAFYSPTELCDFISRWAIRSASDKVLEPSCGDASFLLAAARRLKNFGKGRFTKAQLQGVELHEPAASKALARMSDAGSKAEITVADFFDIEPVDQFNAVVGNPPYVRYQSFTGTARAKGQRAALAQGVHLTGLASSWAAFVVHASQFLSPGGRLGLILPAELLSVNYAAEVRRFLLKTFASIKLVMFEERVFPGVLEEVVILLAEGTGPTDHFELYQARNITDLSDVGALPWSVTPVGNISKWIPGLLDNSVIETYVDLLTPDRFIELSEWGRSYLGAVTGNNRWFCLTTTQATQLGLQVEELRRISPPGSRHLRGLTFTKATWEEMAQAGKRVYLFYPPVEHSTGASTRIKAGEQDGIHNAYKCRVRPIWWRVPIVEVPDLLLTYMNHDTPRIVTNRARALHLNSIHGISLNKGLKQLGMDLLPIASLNSMTLLGAEIVGRAYGGGMLKVEPREADQLPVPSPELVRRASKELRALRPQISIALRQGDLLGAAKIVDRVLFTRHLKVRYDKLKLLRDGRHRLFSRRVARRG